MIGKPKVDERNEQNYVGIRSQVPVSKLKKVIPESLDTLFPWLEKQGIEPAGAPFIRYHVINMEGKMDVELGIPVANPVAGEGRIMPGVLPAGRYASLIYQDIKNGIKANGALLEWGAAQGLKWDRWDDPNGDAFRGRYESFITDPAEEPDPAKWDTEVAIRLAD
jgi:effector-binding domain-containing protein